MSGHFGTGAEVSSGHFAEDTSALVPKCLGSEVSWVRSVLTPNILVVGTVNNTAHKVTIKTSPI